MRLLTAILLFAFSTVIAKAGDDDLAIIIAIKRYDYAHDVAYADRDGEAMRDFARRVLAIPEKRIIVVGDGAKGDGKASFADLRALFRTAIPQRLEGRSAKRVWVYYSGHGVPGRGTQGDAAPYLLPRDGRPSAPDDTALKLDDVEAALTAAVRKHAPGAQMVLILDACFSGRSESDPATRDAKGRTLSPESSAGGPVRLTPRKASDDLIVLAAARDDEIASWDREARHGLFTDLLLQAFFKGVGEGGRVTVGSFESFARARMDERLALLFPGGGRRQQPDIRGARSLVLVDNAGKHVLDPQSRDQAMVMCNGLKNARDAKAIGDFLASPLCARGCDSACVTTLSERQRRLEAEATECTSRGNAIDALIAQKLGPDVIQGALAAVPERCADVRARALAAIEAAAPKVSDTAPKTLAIEPKRPGAVSVTARDPALSVVPGSGRSFRDKLADGRECAFCPEMVVVPPGSFDMGSSPKEIEALTKAYPRNKEFLDAEGPQRTVKIGRAFAIGKFEVTRGQFAAFAKATGRQAKGGCYTVDHVGRWYEPNDASWHSPGFFQDDTHPVVCVTWQDVTAYTEWLSQNTGKGYRLLSEAEWEYAARARSRTHHHFGDDSLDLCTFGNVADQIAKRSFNDLAAISCSDGFTTTTSAGRFRPNPWGLHDMHGNVWEWVEDCAHAGYFGAPTDGSAWSASCSDIARVVRGGSWSSNTPDLRSASRRTLRPDDFASNTGFRLARTLAGVHGATCHPLTVDFAPIALVVGERVCDATGRHTATVEQIADRVIRFRQNNGAALSCPAGEVCRFDWPGAALFFRVDAESDPARGITPHGTIRPR